MRPPGREALSLVMATTAAASSRAAFFDPRFRRVRDVDDATMSHLLRLLLRLRRIKHALAASGFLGGAVWSAGLPLADPLHAFLFQATFASMVGMPALGTGTLAVRRIFLRESVRLGLSRSAALLLLTRAERRERLRPVPARRTEERVELLLSSVRAWDEA